MLTVTNYYPSLLEMLKYISLSVQTPSRMELCHYAIKVICNYDNIEPQLHPISKGR